MLRFGTATKCVNHRETGNFLLTIPLEELREESRILQRTSCVYLMEDSTKQEIVLVFHRIEQETNILCSKTRKRALEQFRLGFQVAAVFEHLDSALWKDFMQIGIWAK